MPVSLISATRFMSATSASLLRIIASPMMVGASTWRSAGKAVFKNSRGRNAYSPQIPMVPSVSPRSVRKSWR